VDGRTHGKRSAPLFLLLWLLILWLVPQGCSDDTSAVDTRPVVADFSIDQAPTRDGLDALSVADVGVDAPVDSGVDGQAHDLARDGSVDVWMGPLSLRVMAANLTSGNLQSYDAGHGARIIKAFAPDIVLIQEFNVGENEDVELRAFVDQTLGSSYHYIRGTGMIPNGVISRYPIVESGEWIDSEASNRNFSWAKIALPGGRDLWAISVHLLSGKTASSRRHVEANELLDHIKSNIPAGSLTLLGGDFNTETRSEGCVGVLRARFVAATPYPADQLDNDNTNAPRNHPYDWVLASPALHQQSTPLSIGANTFEAGLVFDSRVYTPLSDVPPVLVDDSAADQMQHMAVIRQFYWE